MEKKVIKWGNWEELNKALGFGQPKPAQKKELANKKVKIEKFAKCKNCGGQMTYIKGTNAFICDCEVEREKEKIVKNKDGTESKVKYKVKEPCGATNLVAEEYQSYMRYLFD